MSLHVGERRDVYRIQVDGNTRTDMMGTLADHAAMAGTTALLTPSYEHSQRGSTGDAN
jgi:hypothetical protein